MTNILITVTLFLVSLSTCSFAGGKNFIKAKVPPVSVDSWSGFYIGSEVGATHTKGDVVILDPSEFTIKANGGDFGLFAGYNWLQDETLLFGVEIDLLQGTTKKRVDDKLEEHPNGEYELKETLHGAIVSRVGKVIDDKYLAYVTFGASWTRLKVLSNPSTTKSKIAIVPGLTVGSGVEMKFSEALHFRLEYRYNHYKRANFVHQAIGASNIKYKSHMIQLGVSYKFN